MLDLFLEASYTKSRKEQEKRAFVDQLKKLPNYELAKLASGETKLSHLGCESGMEFLEKFRDTPLFDQALALEQQSIQVEMERTQQRMERPPMDETYAKEDQIRLQKRMLELQLAQMQAQGAQAAAVPAGPPGAPPASPEAGAQGAGAPGPMDASQPGPEGTAGLKAASVLGPYDLWGRQLAQGEVAKLKFAYALEKRALNVGAGLSAMGQGAKMWGKSLGGAALPGLVGAGVGAIGGAAAGLQKDEQGNRSITKGVLGGLAGGALGGAAGMTAGNAAALRSATPSMGLGSALAQGAGQTAGQIGRGAKGIYAMGHEAAGLPIRAKAPAAAAAAAAPAAETAASQAATAAARPPGPAAAASTLKSPLANPTMVGSQQMSQHYSSLPEPLRKSIESHPLVAQHGMAPEAAMGLIGMSGNPGEHFADTAGRLLAQGSTPTAQGLGGASRSMVTSRPGMAA